MRGFRDISPILKNQMEESVDNVINIGVAYRGLAKSFGR